MPVTSLPPVQETELALSVERAYREFRHEATDAPWDHAKVFDAVLAVAKAKGIAVEF